MRRVVITGIGAVTPLANSFPGSWELLKQGVTGLKEITRFDASGLPWRIAGELARFDASLYLSSKEQSRLDPFVHYSVAAAVMAAEDAGLINDRQASSVRRNALTDKDNNSLDASRITHHALRSSAGIIIGSSRGGITFIERDVRKACGPGAGQRTPRLSPFLMPSTTITMAAAHSARKLGIRGHCLGVSNACASGANAIGEAMRLIQYGKTELVFAGGTEAPLCRVCVEGYGIAGALSKTGDASASRPFDGKRSGFILSEGAAVLVLEDYESALRRGAAVYAEVAGYGNTTDAFHMTKPDAAGEARAMRAALEDAAVSPSDIDYINAHGTSTVLGDRAEAEAIRTVFKEKGRQLPISAVKSMTGHMLAASGAFEAACAAMSIREGIIPPTINHDETDPACDINVATEKKTTSIEYALSNSFGFGGVNAVLVLKKC